MEDVAEDLISNLGQTSTDRIPPAQDQHPTTVRQHQLNPFKISCNFASDASTFCGHSPVIRTFFNISPYIIGYYTETLV